MSSTTVWITRDGWSCPNTKCSVSPTHPFRVTYTRDRAPASSSHQVGDVVDTSAGESSLADTRILEVLRVAPGSAHLRRLGS